jgi:RND family efflux transporter MFP subunit
VEVGIPDKLIYSLSPGKKARVEFNALPGNEYNATVTEVGMQPNPESTYPVTLVLNSPAPKIRPGMSALVEFNFQKTQKNAILLPLSAVAHEAYGPKYVWEVDPRTMKTRKKTVTTGAVSEDRIRILSGVKNGDIIVVRGVHRLRPGMRVKPIKADNP